MLKGEGAAPKMFPRLVLRASGFVLRASELGHWNLEFVSTSFPLSSVFCPQMRRAPQLARRRLGEHALPYSLRRPHLFPLYFTL